MKKKLYVKPEVNMVLLRTEERLAACDGFYYSTYSTVGCNSRQWQLTNPSTCYMVLSEVAGS